MTGGTPRLSIILQGWEQPLHSSKNINLLPALILHANRLMQSFENDSLSKNDLGPPSPPIEQKLSSLMDGSLYVFQKNSL